MSRPLHDVIHGYLGPSRFDGASALYIGADIETAQYGPGQWHHDRCGRRLKLFVYLSDVNAEAHPTQVASGTHNTVYFSNFSPESRFLDEYVQATHTVVDLTGTGAQDAAIGQVAWEKLGGGGASQVPVGARTPTRRHHTK